MIISLIGTYCFMFKDNINNQSMKINRNKSQLSNKNKRSSSNNTLHNKQVIAL